MDQKLKDLLQAKLNDLPAGDAAPGFDRAQTWDALARRLDPPRRRLVLPLPRWSYAAAALVAGLLLGGPLLRFLKPARPAERVVVVEKQPAGVPPAARQTPAPETGTPGAAVATAAPARPVPAATPARLPVPTSAARPVAPAPVAAVAATPALQPVPAVPVAGAAPALRRAAHLLDLQTEDRTALLEGAAPAGTGTAFTLYLSPKRLPEGRDAGAPASVLRPLLR